MTFTLLDLVMLGLAVAGAAWAGRGLRGRAPALAPLVAAGGLLLLTVVFDNLMIAAGLFDYAPEHRTGLLLGRAPVEDLAYPLGVLVLLPVLWRRWRTSPPTAEEDS
ncbi:lycopene cyclase domain-containing protein [Arsenicicoccus dermatophilus]|uniref:lycopene cyclase domain-containing protein n=1 Tax=Arsenicicoccus dermatophilus TaxID=1076331 RepID=UPI003916FB5E